MDCNHKFVTTADGEEVCVLCGLVRERYAIPITSSLPRWHTVEKSDTLGSVISDSGRDAYGNQLSPEASQRFRRLAKIQNRLIAKEGKRFSGFSTIAALCGGNKSIRKRAEGIYCEIVGRLRGRPFESVAHIAYFIACGGYSIKEYVSNLGPPLKDQVLANYKTLMRCGYIKPNTFGLENYLRKYSEIFSLDFGALKEFSDFILSRVRFSGHSPSGVAAAIIHIFNQKISLGEICEKTGVSKTVIREKARKILSKIPEDELKKFRKPLP